MSDELEAAIAAAVGAQPENPEDQPTALNDRDGLRKLILNALHNHDTNHARQKQSTDALQQIIRTVEK